MLDQGIDPAEERKSHKATGTEAAVTFATLAREWADKKDTEGKWTERTSLKRRSWLARLNLRIGQTPVADLTAKSLLEALRSVEKTTGYTADRLRGMSVEILNYAVACGHREDNPAIYLRGAITIKPEQHRAAIISPRRLGEVLRIMDSASAHPSIKTAARIAPYVFTRPGELRFARWSEIDLDKGIWEIPSSRTKMRKDHIVPLSRQVVELLRDLQPITGTCEYIFETSGGKPYSENTLNKHMQKSGIGSEEATQHGWRATARTLLDEVLGARVDWIEHQLGHAVRDANGLAYNRTTHLEGRATMMQEWADYLDGLKDN